MKDDMQKIKETPPLPIASSLRGALKVGEDLPATRAHEVLLHCAMDAACVPPSLREAGATARIAELDYQTVVTVIAWLRAASSRNS